MEFVIWGAVIVVVLAGGAFALSSVRKRNIAKVNESISREAAQEANAKLTDEARNTIYRSLAKGDLMAAVKSYHQLTGDKVQACVIAVRSLDKYPQSAPVKELPIDETEIQALRDKLEERTALEEGGGQSTEAAERSEPASLQESQAVDAEDAWVIPAEWNDQFGSQNEPNATHFKMAFELDGEQREFSSEQLPPNEYDQLFSMLRDSDFAGAAGVLHQYTGLPLEDLQRMIAASPMAGESTHANVADFRFEGQGPNGPVHFDAADLPEDEREALFDAIADHDLQAMSQIIVRHTSLPEDVVQNMLRTFVKRQD